MSRTELCRAGPYKPFTKLKYLHATERSRHSLSRRLWSPLRFGNSKQMLLFWNVKSNLRNFLNALPDEKFKLICA